MRRNRRQHFPYEPPPAQPRGSRSWFTPQVLAAAIAVVVVVIVILLR